MKRIKLNEIILKLIEDYELKRISLAGCVLEISLQAELLLGGE